MRQMEARDEHDDVDTVTYNFDIPEAVLEAAQA